MTCPWSISGVDTKLTVSDGLRCTLHLEHGIDTIHDRLQHSILQKTLVLQPPPKSFKIAIKLDDILIQHLGATQPEKTYELDGEQLTFGFLLREIQSLWKPDSAWEVWCPKEMTVHVTYPLEGTASEEADA
jgi:hypothetical protein